MPSSRSLSTTSNFDVYLRHNLNNTPNHSDTESGYGRSRSLTRNPSETDASRRVAFCSMKNCDRYAEVYCDSQCHVTSLKIRPFEWKGCSRAVCHKHSVIRHEHGDITMCRRCEGDFEQLLQENTLMSSCSCFGFFKSKKKKNPEKQALLKKKKHRQAYLV